MGFSLRLGVQRMLRQIGAGPIGVGTRSHTSVVDHAKSSVRAAAAGGYALVLTIHVDDVDGAYVRAKKIGAEIVAEIRDEEYGQRHFLVIDPNGLLLNVMSSI
jgi:uncharacterized glyoxalase superfamily protein PhnB